VTPEKMKQIYCCEAAALIVSMLVFTSNHESLIGLLDVVNQILSSVHWATTPSN